MIQMGLTVEPTIESLSSWHGCLDCLPVVQIVGFLRAWCCRILHTLRVRYTLDMIYTYSGNILIAVGPLFPHNATSLPTPLIQSV